MLLAPAFAVIVVAASGPDQGCPSPRQVTDALSTRLPGVVVPATAIGAPSALRLTVSGGTGPAPLRIDLVDPNGEGRLQRVLSLAERGRGSDCPALAETVALIVDRYLHDVGYEAPFSTAPPPEAPPQKPSEPEVDEARAPPAPRSTASAPPRNRFDLFAAGGWRGTVGQEEADDFELGFGFGFERPRGAGRVGATLSGGVSPVERATLPAGNGTLRRFPLRLGLFVPLLLGPGWIEPGAGVTIDWLRTSWSAGGAAAQNQVSASPAADLGLGYRLDLVGGLFLRATAVVAMGIPYHFVTPAANGAVGEQRVFSTSRFSMKSGLQLGFSFR